MVDSSSTPSRQPSGVYTNMKTQPYQERTLPYLKGERKLWRKRLLQGEWFREYPELFDCDDLKLAMRRDKKSYEFGEWLTAIHFWNKGFHVLLPKYTHKANEVKYQKAVDLLGKKDVKKLARPGRPDLLAYKDKEHLVFVEVKVEGDRVSRTQRKMMRRIAKYFGKDRHVQIFVYHVRAGVRKRIATRSQSHKEVERKLREGKVMSSQLFLAA